MRRAILSIGLGTVLGCTWWTMTVLVDLTLALDRAAVVSLNGPAAALAICVRVLTKRSVNIGEPDFLYEVLLLDMLLGSLVLYVLSCRVAEKRRSTSA